MRLEDELLSLREVADALGLPHRRIRSWADAGTLDTVQHVRHCERMVLGSELLRLARLGYRVRWPATSATSATSETLSNEGLP